MTKLPLVTIITPTYNSEKTIETSILSVANQRYINKEHLIIDGQSSDNTLDIIKKYAAKYPHIKWKSEKDDGIYEAMNKGIDWSSGEWVYFLGDDDIFYDNDVLVNILTPEVSNLDVIYGNVQWGETDQIYDGPFSQLKLMEKNICQQAIFFKKNVFTQLGEFQTEYDSWADWVFNMKWFNSENIHWKYVKNVIAKFNTTGHSCQKADKAFLKNRTNLIQTHFPIHYFELIQKITTLAEGDGQIVGLNQALAECEARVHGLKAELTRITLSRSWKMTKPLRFAGRILRGDWAAVRASIHSRRNAK